MTHTKDEALPFGVGGGLVAIKTLLSRDPCVHANTAIEMIDAILKEHPEAQHQCKWPTCQSEEYQQALAEQINQELVTGAAQPAPVQPVKPSLWEQYHAAQPAPVQHVQGPLSFNCSAGCGACGVKLQDFVTHQTQAQEGDEWVVVATEPQIVSTCCGSPVEVWDERKQDITASVDATPPARPAPVPLTDENIEQVFKEHAGYGGDDFISFARAIEAKLKEKNA
jgi:hypothetical protein